MFVFISLNVNVKLYSSHTPSHEEKNSPKSRDCAQKCSQERSLDSRRNVEATFC